MNVQVLCCLLTLWNGVSVGPLRQRLLQVSCRKSFLFVVGQIRSHAVQLAFLSTIQRVATSTVERIVRRRACLPSQLVADTSLSHGAGTFGRRRFDTIVHSV